MSFIICPGSSGATSSTLWGLDKIRDVPKEYIGEPERACAMDAFFREQEKLPPSMRSAGAMLVCHCKKCVARRGIL